MNKIYKELVDRAEKKHYLTKEELIKLLNLKEYSDEYIYLCNAAERVRDKYAGKYIHLRGLIEFSNYCRKNCIYCGLRRDNKKLIRYRILEDELFEITKKAFLLGYKTFVLQSGEDFFYDIDYLIFIINKIKQEYDVAITLSIGERSFEDFDKLINAGVDRYLIRIETTDKNLFKSLHPDDDFFIRLKILQYLKSKKIEVGTGVMIGLPNQTIEMLAEDLLFYKEFDPDMVGQGPFIPNPNTPLKGYSGGDLFTTLKMIALTRLLNPDINIPATTALTTLSINDARQKAFKCGANVVMPNVTPKKYRKLYEIYPDKACVSEEPKDCKTCITKIILNCGLNIGTDYGNRKKIKFD